MTNLELNAIYHTLNVLLDRMENALFKLGDCENSLKLSKLNAAVNSLKKLEGKVHFNAVLFMFDRRTYISIT
jgi:hypothetical protein